MKVLRDTWDGLIARKLWPIALLLLLALVALPILLGHTASSTPVSPAAQTGGATPNGSNATVVSLGQASLPPPPQIVVGAAKDPFTPTVGAPVTSTTATTLGTSGTSSSQAATTIPSTSSSTTTTPSTSIPNTTTTTPKRTTTTAPTTTPPTTTPTPTITPTPTVKQKTSTTPTTLKKAVYRLTLRWGLVGGKTPRIRRIRSATALSSPVHPVTVFLDVLKDGKSAVFYVDSAALASGQGVCRPATSNCQLVTLQAGQSEDFQVTVKGVVQKYHLQLLKVQAVTTKKTKIAFTGTADQAGIGAPFEPLSLLQIAEQPAPSSP